jgi:hypothetical protein
MALRILVNLHKLEMSACTSEIWQATELNVLRGPRIVVNMLPLVAFNSSGSA